MTTKRKKKQSASRNADTQFMNSIWRENERLKAERSQRIRERELNARERARGELNDMLGALR